MQVRSRLPSRSRKRPVESRSVIVVAHRVVEIETRHLAESLWSASGWVSDPLPTGPRVSRPIILHGFGQTETEATADLCHQVEQLPEFSPRIPQPELPS
jgi:hypothetical protein